MLFLNIECVKLSVSYDYISIKPEKKGGNDRKVKIHVSLILNN